MNQKKLEWIDCTEAELPQYQPITQVYGVCFDEKNNICLTDGHRGWTIPGGTPEEGEDFRQTLTREMMEEVTVDITDIRVLGVQKVFQPDRTFYQMRCAAKITKVNPLLPDPADKRLRKRLFVPALEVEKYVKWGDVGRALFAKARTEFGIYVL